MITFNVAFVGESRAGKTALMKKVTFASNPLVTKPTAGAQSFTIQRMIKGQTVNLQCADLGCAPRVIALSQMYIRKNDAIFIGIDLTRDAVTQATQWINYVNKNKSNDSDPMIILIGTKSDLISDKRQDEYLANFAKTNHMPYFITSVVKDTNLESVFTKIATLCLEVTPKTATDKTILNNPQYQRSYQRIINDGEPDKPNKTRLQKLFSCCG